LLKSRDFVNGEPFAVILGDHAFLSGNGQPVIKQLTDAFKRTQETTYGVAVEDEETLLKTATFCGAPISKYSGDGSLFKATKLMAYPIQPEIARRELRTEGLEKGKYLVSFGAMVYMPVLYTKMEALAAEMHNARDGGGTCDAAGCELIVEGSASLVQISGQRLDIGLPLAYTDTLGVLAEAGRKRRKVQNGNGHQA